MREDDLWRSHRNDDEDERQECANCGTYGDGLLRCSRCKLDWFCSLKCHKAYWPVHKEFCKPNEFADSLDGVEPKFARWMRRHGKLAVLKDQQVERIERASQGLGPSTRQDVMESMYGRIDPQPRAATYSADEVAAVHLVRRQEAAQARLMTAQDKAWADFSIPAELGLDCPRYKWRQNQSHVEAVIRLPPAAVPSKVHVQLGKQLLQVALPDDVLLQGPLYAAVVPSSSTWYVDCDSSTLHISLLKASRRGRYHPGHTNADTFWWALLGNAPDEEVLQMEHPPTRYYWSEYEEDDLVKERARGRRPPALPAATQPKQLITA